MVDKAELRYNNNNKKKKYFTLLLICYFHIRVKEHKLTHKSHKLTEVFVNFSLKIALVATADVSSLLEKYSIPLLTERFLLYYEKKLYEKKTFVLQFDAENYLLLLILINKEQQRYLNEEIFYM